MFPVTRQVRRKRTPVFGRPGRIRGSADESEESGGERRSMRAEGGPGREAAEKAGAGLSQKQGRLGESSVGLRERAAWARGSSKAGPTGERKAGLGEDTRSPDKQTHRWPRTVRPPIGTRPALLSGGPIPPGTPPLGRRPPAPPGTNDAIRPAPPPSQKCRGRSAGTPRLHGVRITRELQRARASARPRTPRRCWREYARAH
jgi:hypothetical protein